MGWVKQEIAADRHVRGIIVASDFSEGLRYASMITPEVELKRYEISFQFSGVAAGGES